MDNSTGAACSQLLCYGQCTSEPPLMDHHLYPDVNMPSASVHQAQSPTWSVRPSIWALLGSFSWSLLDMRDTLLPPDPPMGPPKAPSRPEGLLESWSLEVLTALGVLGAFPVAEARLDSLCSVGG